MVWYVFQFRKCLIQLLSCSSNTTVEVNQSTDRAVMTGESNTGEMSAIAARIPAASTPNPNEQHSNSCSYSPLPIPENKVCPM
ncbi:vertebrate ancient long opsin a [Tachysurus ichikawai]